VQLYTVEHRLTDAFALLQPVFDADAVVDTRVQAGYGCFFRSSFKRGEGALRQTPLKMGVVGERDHAEQVCKKPFKKGWVS
jgi:hypothetical protein